MTTPDQDTLEQHHALLLKALPIIRRASPSQRPRNEQAHDTGLGDDDIPRFLVHLSSACSILISYLVAIRNNGSASTYAQQIEHAATTLDSALNENLGEDYGVEVDLVHERLRHQDRIITLTTILKDITQSATRTSLCTCKQVFGMRSFAIAAQCASRHLFSSIDRP